MTKGSSISGAKLDWFRVLCAVLVVEIHTQPLEKIFPVGDLVLTRMIARIAVPFFFMVSGYFLREKLERGRLERTVRKLGLLYLGAVALYLPLNLYMGQHRGLTVGALVRDLVLDGTFYHLWYFPAAIVGILLLRMAVRCLGWKGAGILAAVLYLVGVGGDSWYGLAVRLPGGQALYEFLFSWMDYTRNGLFFAPLYLWLGGAARDSTPDRSACLVGLLLSGCALFAEAMLLHHGNLCRFDSMYLSLVPVSVCLFGLLSLDNTADCKQLRVFSLLVYVIHPWCIVVIRFAARMVGLYGLFVEDRVAHFLLVCLLSGLAAAAGTAVWTWLRKRMGGKPVIPARAWLEIDRVALAHNAMTLTQSLPEGEKLMAVVKAEGYGHGAETVARTMQEAGVTAFAVATLGEGIALRRSGIKGEILILGYTPAQAAAQLREYRLTQTVADSAHAAALEAAGKTLSVHIAVDTGMHRLGIPVEDTEALAAVFACEHLRVTGMFTHLCAADSPTPEDQAFTREQIRRFFQAADALKARGLDVGNLHVQASAGMAHYPDLPCAYARAGIALYGASSSGEPLPEGLCSALTLRAGLASVRSVPAGDSVGYGRAFRPETLRRIGVVTIGYADGVPRNYSAGGGQVLLRGKRVPIVGRICMDQLMIDVTDLPDCAPGEAVTLIGRDGAEEITVWEMARKCGTISNEILSRLHVRER